MRPWKIADPVFRKGTSLTQPSEPGGPTLTYQIRTTAIFLRPFELAGFDEVLPAGEYELQTELLDPVDWIEPGSWTSSVLVHLHPRESHPGLSRTLTVPLSELEHALAKDKLTGKALTDFFLEEMLSDPMICLVMQADGVSEEEIRDLYSTEGRKSPKSLHAEREDQSPAKNERRKGPFPHPGSSRPGIGE